MTKILSYAGAAGCLLLLYDATTRGTRITPNYLLNNLVAIRLANFESLNKSLELTATAKVGGYLAAASFLSVIAAVRLGRSGGWTVVILGTLNLLLLGAVGLFVYGGRTLFFYATMLVGLAMYLGGWRMLTIKPRTILVGITTLLIIWFFAISWLRTREGSISVESVLMMTQHAEFHPWIKPLIADNERAQLGLLSLGYFASPLATLTYYVQQEMPGPFFGQYTYPLPTSIGAKIAGIQPERSWIEIRREIFRPLEAGGYFGNVWPTWLRDLLVDFGYAGTLLFCGVFGSFMAWARNRFDATGGLHYHWFEVLACFALAFGAFQNVLWFSFLQYAFFLAVPMMFAIRIRVIPPNLHFSGSKLGPID